MITRQMLRDPSTHHRGCPMMTNTIMVRLYTFKKMVTSHKGLDAIMD
jgi:hypothetical protein